MTRTTASSNPTCARLPTIHTAALKCTPALFHTSHPTLLPPALALYYPFTLLEFSLTLVPTHSLTGWLVGLPFRFQLEWVVVLFEGKTKEKKRNTATGHLETRYGTRSQVPSGSRHSRLQETVHTTDDVPIVSHGKTKFAQVSNQSPPFSVR